MTFVTASIEIDAPVASVWNTLVDAGAYSDWHPFFPHGLDTGHDLRSGDQVTAILPVADGLVPVSALVLEVWRHRTITWLLLPETTAHAAPVGAGDRLELAGVGLYRVDVRETCPGRTLVGQHLRVGSVLGWAQADCRELASLLDTANEVVRQRVEQAAAHASGGHQIAGTIRVTSRLGAFHRDVRPRSGLFTGIVDWVAHWPGGAAA